jgi:septum formation protein
VRRVVLASGSPRRRELLSRFIPDLVIDPADIDEDGHGSAGEPVEAVIAAASAKALEVAPRHPGVIVIGCDTAVVLERRMLGKPRDEAEAALMILDLAGRDHEVITGIALSESADGRSAEVIAADAVRTRVHFRPLDWEAARAYVARGESLDKAGAYGIQGHGALLVDRIEGCYFNVVGLPLHRLSLMLAAAGVPLL